MEINKTQLKEALEIVKPGLSNKDLIEQSTSFAFMEGTVVTFNDKISVSHPVEGLDITGAIKAEEMYKVLTRIKTEKLKVSVSDSEVRIKAGKIVVGLQLTEEILLPLDEIDEIGEFKKLPKDFVNQIALVSQAASRDMSMPVLTCIEVSKKNLSASDNARVSRAILKKAVPVDTFLLPADLIPVLIKIDPTEIALTKSWVHFTNEQGTMLSARIFADTFPDVEPILDVPGGIDIVLPKELATMVETASIFSEGQTLLDEKVTIQIDDGKIRVKSECASGWYKEAAKCEYKGEPITFEMTPYLFKEVLGKVPHCLYNEEQGVIKFENETWQYVVSLM